MLFIIFVITGMALIAFQNFTPHDPFKTHDVSDIYMNSALSTALKTKTEKRSPQQVALNSEVEAVKEENDKGSQDGDGAEVNDPDHTIETNH